MSAPSVVVNGERYFPETLLVDALATVYSDDPSPNAKRIVAKLCDDFLDRSGRLLGLVRKTVNAP